jgi:hypothetical protein
VAEAKIRYRTREGYFSTAYVVITGNKAVGTNKYTDLPVEVVWDFVEDAWQE